MNDISKIVVKPANARNIRRFSRLVSRVSVRGAGVDRAGDIR